MKEGKRGGGDNLVGKEKNATQQATGADIEPTPSSGFLPF